MSSQLGIWIILVVIAFIIGCNSADIYTLQQQVVQDICDQATEAAD